jgi:hypothetical protein
MGCFHEVKIDNSGKESAGEIPEPGGEVFY